MAFQRFLWDQESDREWCISPSQNIGMEVDGGDGPFRHEEVVTLMEIDVLLDEEIVIITLRYQAVMA